MAALRLAPGTWSPCSIPLFFLLWSGQWLSSHSGGFVHQMEMGTAGEFYRGGVGRCFSSPTFPEVATALGRSMWASAFLCGILACCFLFLLYRVLACFPMDWCIRKGLRLVLMVTFPLPIFWYIYSPFLGSQNCCCSYYAHRDNYIGWWVGELFSKI